MEDFCNSVVLRGALSGRPEFSHNGRTEEFFTFPLEITRLSGAVDTINIIAEKQLLQMTEIDDGDCVEIIGELRSYNNKSGSGSRLVITVLAKSIQITDGEDMNSVTLCGVLCKKPNLRRTPMGRQICDMMIAVNRKYGRSDYLPCIAWGQTAQNTAELNVGDRVKVEGRIQSRKYIKNDNGIPVERTAFEVSAVSVEWKIK